MVVKKKSMAFASGRLARERASPPGEAALAPRAATRELPPRAPSAPAAQKPRQRAVTAAAAPAPLRPHRGARSASYHFQPHSVYYQGAFRRLGSDTIVEAEDVIDLGAPRLPRKPLSGRGRTGRPLLQRARRPNPRLYPGPKRTKPKVPANRVENRGGGEGRRRRRKRIFRRVVPNSRLYRPAPARPPPPPASPRAAWPPPAPLARLDTASRAALRLSEQRRAPREPPREPPPRELPPREPPPLVVTLPGAGDGALRRYRPASDHFRVRSLDTESGESTPVAGRSGLPAAAPVMDASNRNSTSPEDCSDGNETLSAPSEFLAEFLSAIMRRQYAEALKYCRLILQYEPHNATARGFYPLLQHKVQAHKRPEQEGPRGSSSEEASAPASDAPRCEPPPHKHEMMEQGGDSSECSEEEGGASRSSSRSRSGGSCGSQSSLELDSSEALAHSSPSISLSRRTEHTDSASGGCWESTGSASRSDADDNGNAPAPAARLCAGDVENDNAAAAEPLSVAHHKSESPSLRRLRAQFTCSIK